MHRFLFAIALALASGCAGPMPGVNPDSAEGTQADKPNLQVSLRTPHGIDNINVKHGRPSFLNYSPGTSDRRTVPVTVSDSTYVALRDSCFAILKDPPLPVDGDHVIHINVPLFGQSLAERGLSTNTCTFTYRPGLTGHVDKLYGLTTELLDEHRK